VEHHRAQGGSLPLHALLSLFVWELLQNIPLVAGFILALTWQRAGALAPAAAALAVGAALGGWVINVTEGRIFSDFIPSTRHMLTNSLSFFALTIVSVLYFGALWSGYLSDLAGGAVVAFALTYLEDPERARSPFNLRRALSLTASAVVSLWIIRALMDAPWAAFTAATLWFTVVMSVYKALRWRRKPETRVGGA
jgi:hypothetical protein